MGSTYFNDISAYVKYGNKQSYSPMTTAINQFNSKETADLKDKIIKRSAKFGRVAVVTGLAIVSAPVAIASSIVAAPLATLYMFACDLKSNIKIYITFPERCNLTGLLKKTGADVLFAIGAFFITFGSLSADLTLLLATYLIHTNHMQIWNTLTNNNSNNTVSA
jgi:hypothetical protein